MRNVITNRVKSRIRILFKFDRDVGHCLDFKVKILSLTIFILKHQGFRIRLELTRIRIRIWVRPWRKQTGSGSDSRIETRFRKFYLELISFNIKYDLITYLVITNFKRDFLPGYLYQIRIRIRPFQTRIPNPDQKTRIDYLLSMAIVAARGNFRLSFMSA